jgi:hypothetical protein
MSRQTSPAPQTAPRGHATAPQGIKFPISPARPFERMKTSTPHLAARWTGEPQRLAVFSAVNPRAQAVPCHHARADEANQGFEVSGVAGV